MLVFTSICKLSAAALLTFVVLGAAPGIAHAQMSSSPATSAAPSRPAISVLQQALNEQGVAIKVDGVLGDATRAALRQFQSQHHLPVTGEPDKATLDKLGVSAAGSSVQAPMGRPRMATPKEGGMQDGMMKGGMMESCATMHRDMQSMMAMMQDMMKSMREMQPQMLPKAN